MTHYVLDARTATPHFPGIGRYMTNLAAALAPLLASDECLTILHHSDHPPALPDSPAVTLVPVDVSPFALAQQWQIPRLLRGFASRNQESGIRSQESGVRSERAAAQPRSSVVGRRSSVLYHSGFNLMPYAPGVPTIVTLHDLIPLLMPEQSSGRARLLARWANVLALRAARVALAISEATRRDYLAHFRVPAERIITTPLAADRAFRPQPDAAIAALRARYALPERYVLYLGSNKPHKNLVGLIEAWQIAPTGSKSANQRINESTNGRISESASQQIGKSAERGSRLTFDVSRTPALAPKHSAGASVTSHASRLVIAGAWDDRYPEAKQRVAALGLGDSVRFLGPVPEADLPALYAGAELFVFPSLYEGFGLPVLEAMACGTPVICSNTSSLPEVAGDAAVQVDPLDVDALATAIGRVLGDEALAEELRQRGLQQAARFTWAQTAQQTLAVYRSQMAGLAQTH